MELKDKKIIVTGGSSGIGKATAKLLIDSGAKVIITGRDKAKVGKVAAEIGAIPLAFDISNYNVLKQKADEALEKLGGIDVLINNAGVGKFGLIEDVKIEDWEYVFGTNIFGLSTFTTNLIPTLQSQKSGMIVNIASTAALKGFAQGSVYAASKFALRGLTECWRAELRKFNIRVTLINPSAVPTAFNVNDRTEKEEQEKHLTSMEIAHTIKACVAMDNRGFIPEVSVWATNPF